MRVGTLTLALVLASGATTFAQHTLDHPVGQDVFYDLDSGVRWNSLSSPSIVYAAVITMPDVAWIRLYFRETKLGPGSSLRITSLWDHEVQTLDAAGLAMWSSSSAYFNGNQ